MGIFNRFPPRGTQTDAKWQSAWARDLKDFIPTRPTLNFQELNTSLSDEYYEGIFEALYLAVYDSVTAVFQPDDLPRGAFPWLRPDMKELIRYTELLAHPGTSGNNWDTLLVDGEQRSFLIQAIIMKVLDTSVFSSLLFGASDEHRDILHKEDISLVNLEGYERTYLRSRTNMLYLNTTDYEPPHFWAEVDLITSQLMTLLMPMYIIAGKANPDGMLRPSVLCQYLHDIVALAGWTNIAIRVSPSITVLDWLNPGDQHEMQDENMSPEIHARSRKESDRRDLLKGEKPRRRPRVKISIIPRVNRYIAATQAEVVGNSTYVVLKAHAVYYDGYEDDFVDLHHALSLPDHIKRRKDKKAKRDALLSGARSVGIILMVFIAWALARLTGYESRIVDMAHRLASE